MVRGKKKPVAGYPSISTGVLALTLAGGLPQAIAAQLGVLPQRVYAIQSALRLRRKLPPAGSPMPKPIWTPEKRDKAARLLVSTLGLIAEALQVPVRELVTLVGAGLEFPTPPLPDEIVAELEEEPTLPSREDDEAELAAMEEESDDADADVDADEPETEPVGEETAAPGAPSGTRFKLRNDLGDYLHEHEHGMTRLPKFFWRGSEADVRTLKKRRPQFRDLYEEASSA